MRMTSLVPVLAVCLAFACQGVMYGQSGPKDGAALSPADLDRIQAGQLAPDFTLPTAEGKAVTLSGLRDKDVVLVFYRGHW